MAAWATNGRRFVGALAPLAGNRLVIEVVRDGDAVEDRAQLKALTLNDPAETLPRMSSTL